MEAAARAGDRAAPLAFSYGRAVAPMLWALTALGVMELFIVHLLVALLWSRTAAVLLSLLTIGFIAWLVLLIRSLGRLPVLVDGSTILMRVGFLRAVELRRDDVAAVRTAFSGQELKQPGVLNLALLAFPNVVVEMKQPFEGRKLRLIAHRLDEPAAFVAAAALPRG